MLETAPSFSIYSQIEEEEEKEKGLASKVAKTALTVETNNNEHVHFHVEGSGDFSFIKPTMDLIKEDEKEVADDDYDDNDDLGGTHKFGTEEMVPPSSPPMYLAAGLGIGGSGFGGQMFGEGEEVSEEYCRELLEEFPNHPVILRKYAELLQGKEDLQGAEEYYFRAAQADPGDGVTLLQYAKLVWELHHDRDRALTYFELAVQAAPQDSDVMAAYAKFLWETDDDDDEEKSVHHDYSQSQEENGQNFDQLHNPDDNSNPIFYDGGPNGGADIESYYKKMVEENPSNATFLKKYAQFLYQPNGDLQGAEQYYSRALLADPKDGEILSQYATLIWELNRDQDRTLSYLEQAIEAAPHNSDVLAAYARILWAIDDE